MMFTSAFEFRFWADFEFFLFANACAFPWFCGIYASGESRLVDNNDTIVPLNGKNYLSIPHFIIVEW